MSTNSTGIAPVLQPPHGIEQIILTFGDIYAYIHTDHTLDARWQAEFLDLVALPFPMPLSWDKAQRATQIRCHQLLVPVFSRVFAEIQRLRLEPTITSFGGCFAFRPQRTGSKLSAHAWGIAIDLNPEANLQGTAGNMNAALIAVFREAGFEWGGDWHGRSRDPMHFQFCTGY